MPAPKGNQYWKLRSSHGRSKLFATPEALWEASCEYFEYCDSHPWKVTKTKSKGKGKEIEETPTQCPLSLTGLMAYLDVGKAYWRQFKESNQDEDFSTVITRIENIIQTQQFEGVCVGAFNANIVARMLGLANKRTIDHTNAGNEFKGFNIVMRDPGTDTLKQSNNN